MASRDSLLEQKQPALLEFGTSTTTWHPQHKRGPTHSRVQAQHSNDARQMTVVAGQGRRQNAERLELFRYQQTRLPRLEALVLPWMERRELLAPPEVETAASADEKGYRPSEGVVAPEERLAQLTERHSKKAALRQMAALEASLAPRQADRKGDWKGRQTYETKYTTIMAVTGPAVVKGA